jgi:hypothetical protein
MLKIGDWENADVAFCTRTESQNNILMFGTVYAEPPA